MIPVVVFAFRRPDLLSQTLLALRAERIPRLIAFSDGPRDHRDAAGVRAVRQVLRGVDWCPVEVVERERNLGLGKSVRAGVSQVLSGHESAIFLEDDLVCQPGTYAYLSAALRHYADDERVFSVTGWTHPMITPRVAAPYFDGKGECWVWGTWRRAWTGADRPAAEIMRDCAASGIDLERYGSDMPKMAAEAGPRNLWAVGWWYHHLLHGALCLRPPHSLSEHLGWDDRATTTSPEAARWRNPALRPCPPVPGRWPEPIEHPDCPRLWRIAVGDPGGAA
ncbi:glycosyltransferase [Catellatospora sp. KI3]|uniref:glycosyltransferase n=1 Tax=Catellatospora sp. KI3 TaxID=3041620 RepID=UPI0024832443|nr:glycosyltransferase [Catellatospora sp. KI3]MDI1465401.1 glycosyltransferase [Catellatospora sp. KI3]